MDKQLPIYQMQIDESVDSDIQVDYVSLVDLPAIEKNFLAFNAVQPLTFSTVNDDEHIVVGPAMIPDQPIYRNSESMGEYYVNFSKETIRQIAEKFYKKNFQNNANLMHDHNQKTDGVTFFLSFIRDTPKGMIGLQGDYNEGTWFLGAKINDPEVWKQVKDGTIRGFSVEGMFQYKETKMTKEAIYAEIERLLKILES